MRVELILEAVDRASAVIEKVRGAVEKNEEVAKRNKAADKAYSDAKSGLFDAAATAAAVGAPIYKAVNAYNAYEDVLADIGLKADVAADKLKALDASFRANEKAVNTSRLDIAKGFDQLMAGGLDFDKAAELAAPLAKVTRATKSQIEDVSKSTVALVNNLKVLPAEVQRAFDVMNQTGKDGQFELKDQAQYFPKIGARYAAMGQTGVKAVADLSSALQVMRMNVGTSSEAVTNLEDLLLKFTKSPAIKGFEAMGLDGDKIKERMALAQTTGRIMEEMQAIMQEATKGDLSKLNDIFSDKQALSGATALMQHWQKFLEIRQKALDQGSGSIDRDFLTRMGLGVEKAQALKVAMEGMWSTLGQALAPMVAEKIDQLLNIINTIESWIRLNPELAASIAKVATTAAALMVGVAALKLVFAALRLGGVITAFHLLAGAVRLALIPFAMAGRFLLGVGQGMAAAAAAMGGWRVILAALGSRLLALVAGPLAMLRNALMMIAAAAMANPIGLVVAAVAALAAGAYLLYQNWAKLRPMLSRIWEGIKADAIEKWTALTTFLAGLGAKFTAALSGAWEAVKGWFAGLELPALPALPAIGNIMAGIRADLAAGWQAITAWFATLEWPALPDLSKLFEGFDPLQSIKTALEPVLTFIGEWGGKLTSAFSGIFEKVGGFVSGSIDKISAGFGKVGDLISAISDKLSFGPKLIDPAKMQAGIDKAKEYETQIKAIAPAAQQAVTQASATLAAANFHSHGVRMMETLAQGIRAGSNSAVAAVRETVQKIRDHLPHSPAKTGPLSDLDRVRFSETLATAIERGAPRALASTRMLAAGLAATVAASEPAFARTGGGGPDRAGGEAGGVNGGGDVTVNLTLSPSFSGAQADDFVEQLRKALPDVAYELGQAVKAETGRRERTKF